MMPRGGSALSSILASLTVLASSGCAREVRADLVQHQFEIGDRAFAISLPAEFQRDPNAPFVQFLRSNYRVPRHLRFTADLPTLGGSYKRQSLDRGGELRYNVVPLGSGSGGIEAELLGYVLLDSIAIGIVATDQDEFSPNPEWCIEFLHGLRLSTEK